MNDCSTDNTFKVARNWSLENNYHVSFRKNTKNSGIGFTRLIGVNYCEGDYITYLSSDDCWHPQFLEKAVPLLNECSAVFSDYYQCDQYLKPFNIFKAPVGEMRKQIIDFALEKNMFVNFSCVIFPKKVFTNCNFCEELRHGEDLIFLLDTLICEIEYKHISEPLLFYRIHPTQGSATNPIEEWRQLWLYIKPRLLMLGVPEATIEAAMQKNYNILYPKKTLQWQAKRTIAKLLSKNKTGLKTKKLLKTLVS